MLCVSRGPQRSGTMLLKDPRHVCMYVCMHAVYNGDDPQRSGTMLLEGPTACMYVCMYVCVYMCVLFLMRPPSMHTYTHIYIKGRTRPQTSGQRGCGEVIRQTYTHTCIH
jgi:hypothetical protein